MNNLKLNSSHGGVYISLTRKKKMHATPLQFVHKNKAVLWFGRTMSHKGSCLAFDMPSHVTLVGGGAKQKEVRQLYQRLCQLPEARLVASPIVITEVSTATDGSRCKDHSQTLGREPKLEISTGSFPLGAQGTSQKKGRKNCKKETGRGHQENMTHRIN